MSEDVESNIKLWKKVEVTEKGFHKKVTNGGRSFTSIDAHYQLLTATKLWGSFGDKWGIKEEGFNNFQIGQKLVGDIQGNIMLCQYSTTFYYPGGEFPISSSIKITYVTNTGKFKIDDDYAKKVATDALTKGLSKLGFNADVFMGVYDGNKYDGIENTSIKDGITDKQLEEIKILKEKVTPEQKRWAENAVNNGLDFQEAKTVINNLKGSL